MQRACDRCRKPYEAKRASSRFCSTSCRVAAQRARDSGLPEALVVSPFPADVEVPASSGSVTSATSVQLDAAGRLDSPLGQAALALARRVDSGSENGSALSALVRELRATLVDALDGASATSDVVDELRARRERRGA